MLLRHDDVSLAVFIGVALVVGACGGDGAPAGTGGGAQAGTGGGAQAGTGGGAQVGTGGAQTGSGGQAGSGGGGQAGGGQAGAGGETLCGNEVLDRGEDCDTSEFGSATCEDFGHGFQGALQCDSDCAIDGSGCAFVPGTAVWRRSITIENTSAAALTDYPVLVVVDTGQAIASEKMLPDGADIRFIDDVGAPLSFWIEGGLGTDGRIWVKMPSLAAGASETVYLTYGDWTQVAASSGEDVFPYFASFDDSPLGDNGSDEGISPLTGSWGVVNAGASGQGYEEVGTSQRQSAVVGGSQGDLEVAVRIRLPLAVSGGVNGVYARLTDLNNTYFFGPYAQNGWTLGKYSAGTYSAISEIVVAVEREVWINMALRLLGSTLSGWVEGVQVLSTTDATFATGSFGLRTWGTAVRFDDLRRRPLVSPEPTTGVGPEEPAP
jgi:hypothetical protein